MFIKILKNILIIFLFVMLGFIIYRNYENLQITKEMNLQKIKHEQNRYGLKTGILKLIKQHYKKRLNFIKNNKINFTTTSTKIDEIMNNINEIGGFKIKIKEKRISKEFINVGIIKFDIKTTLKMFDLNEFENIFLKPFKKIGLVLPIKYINPKEGYFYLILFSL